MTFWLSGFEFKFYEAKLERSAISIPQLGCPRRARTIEQLLPYAVATLELVAGILCTPAVRTLPMLPIAWACAMEETGRNLRL